MSHLWRHLTGRDKGRPYIMIFRPFALAEALLQICFPPNPPCKAYTLAGASSTDWPQPQEAVWFGLLNTKPAVNLSTW